MKLAAAVKLFLQHKAHYCARKTLVGYEFTLNRLCTQMGERALERITASDLEKFVGHERRRPNPRTGKPRAAMTHRTLIRHLKIFFLHCLKKKWIRKNPSSDLKYPIGSPLMEFLTAEQVETLLKCRLPKRERAVIELLIGSGLRAFEVVNLDIEDLKLRERYCFVSQGKRDKQRLVGLTSRAARAIRAYIGNREMGAVFLSESYKRSERGARLQVGGLREILLRLERRFGFEFHISPQILRASFSVNFLLNGGTEGDLQMLLGHSQMSQSLEYGRAARLVKALRAHKRFSPGVRK